MFQRVWKNEVDHRFDVIDIQTTRSEIRGDENIDLLVFESFQRVEPLRLREIAVQFADLQTQQTQGDVHSMALLFRLGENDHAIVKRSSEQSGDDRLSIAFAMFADSNKFLAKVRRDRLIVVDEQTDRPIQRDLNQIFDLKRNEKIRSSRTRGVEFTWSVIVAEKSIVWRVREQFWITSFICSK